MSRKSICDVCGEPVDANRVKVKQWHCFFNRFTTEVKDVCIDCWRELEKNRKNEKEGKRR